MQAVKIRGLTLTVTVLELLRYEWTHVVILCETQKPKFIS